MKAVLPSLSSDDVHIWYCWTTTICRRDLAALETTLSPDERLARARLVFDDGRRDYAVAHGLARWVLSTYSRIPATELRIERGVHGKPALAPVQAGDPALCFNIAHTRGLVACAVARGRHVGVDVELVERSRGVRQFDRCCTAAEIERLNRCQGHERLEAFTELWTLKEAYVKAVGLGMTLPLSAVGFEWDGDTGVTCVAANACPGWCFLLASVSAAARLALAVDTPPRRPAAAVTLRSFGRNHERIAVPLRWSPALALATD